MKTLIFILVSVISTLSHAFNLDELEQLLRQTQTVQGGITQARFLKSLDTPLQSSGQFALVQGKGLLWQMEKPLASTMRVSPRGIEQLNPNGEWVSTKQTLGASQQIQLFLDLLSGNADGLKTQFAIQLQGSAQQWHAKLVPNSLVLGKIFSHIELSGNNVVQQIQLFEKQGDRIVISLQPQRINQPLIGLAKDAL